MNEFCRKCMLDLHENNIPDEISADLKEEYLSAVKKLINQKGAVPTGPEVCFQTNELRKRLFGETEKDYSAIKKQYNELMLGLSEGIEYCILNSLDPLKSAIQYAMLGNLIDFRKPDYMEVNKLMEKLSDASKIEADTKCIEQLRKQILKARHMVYITDNCGEIVLDKLLMQQICRMNQEIEIIVIVRGVLVEDDATLDDATQVGLTKFYHCIDNGTQTDGTVIHFMSQEAREAILKSDFIIAKGQANYETLYGCGCNIFYIFMCKCKLFMNRFHVPKDTGIMTHEDPEVLMMEYTDKNLLKQFEFRSILPNESAQVWEIEKTCIIPEETCSLDEMLKRVSIMPEQFLVAVNRETGRIVGFLYGMAVDEEQFQDVCFTDVMLHNPLARTVYLLELAILPQYRHLGLATELMRLYVIREQVRGRHRLMLRTNEEMQGMFGKMGFKEFLFSNPLGNKITRYVMEYELSR